MGAHALRDRARDHPARAEDGRGDRRSTAWSTSRRPVGVIIASNHLSFADSVVIPSIVPRKVVFLAKADYFTGTGVKGALSRAWFEGLGHAAGGPRRHESAMGSLDTALEVLGRGEAFGVYPEGTRSRDGRLYRGRTGVGHLALTAKVPVVPVGLKDTEKLQPVGSQVPAAGPGHRPLRRAAVLRRPLRRRPAGPGPARGHRRDHGRDRRRSAARSRPASTTTARPRADPTHAPGQSRTVPITQVTVSPPTHTAPASSGRRGPGPARPSAVPWRRRTAPQPARRQQPLGERGVEAAGDGVLPSRRRPRRRPAPPPPPRRPADAVRPPRCEPRTVAGRQRQHRSAVASSSATQPGPLSTHAPSTTPSAGDPQILDDLGQHRRPSTGPARTSGGAAKASRVAPAHRHQTAPHSCTTRSGSRGAPPAWSQAWQVPSVGGRRTAAPAPG